MRSYIRITVRAHYFVSGYARERMKQWAFLSCATSRERNASARFFSTRASDDDISRERARVSCFAVSPQQSDLKPLCVTRYFTSRALGVGVHFAEKSVHSVGLGVIAERARLYKFEGVKQRRFKTRSSRRG